MTKRHAGQPNCYADCQAYAAGLERESHHARGERDQMRALLQAAYDARDGQNFDWSSVAVILARVPAPKPWIPHTPGVACACAGCLGVGTKMPSPAVQDATEVVRMLTQVIPFRLGLIEQSDSRDAAKHECAVIRDCLERTLEALKPLGTIEGTATP